MRYHYYLIAHSMPLPVDHETTPLPEPKVVASITVDPVFLGKIDPYKSLSELASKMGLLDFEITSAEAQDRPGFQLGLSFPRPRGKH